MLPKSFPVLALAVLVFLEGCAAVAGKSVSNTNTSFGSCADTYIRGITSEMIHRWEKRKKYAVVRFERVVPISYSLDGVPQKSKELKIQGGAWVAGSGIVSVSHMTDPIQQNVAFGFLAKDLQARQIISDVAVHPEQEWFQLVYEDFTIGGADKIRLKTVDKRYHFAFFELLVDLPDPYSFAVPLGHYDRLSVGSSVFIEGNPYTLGGSFRSGDVSSIKKSKEISAEFAEVSKPLVANSYYLINLPIVWGDSGHSVYAITSCGEAEMVGMAFVFVPGWVYSDLRFVLDVEFIRMFAKTNGVDVDMLQKKYEMWRLTQ